MTSSESESSRSPSLSPIPSPASTAPSISSSLAFDTGAGDGSVNPEFLALFKVAIGKIKGQKQRPSLERLTQALKQLEKGLSGSTIKHQLEYAIRDGHMFKVFSNGKESYKDTENLRKLRKFSVKSPAEVRRAVKFAIREIGDSPHEAGVNEDTIARYVSCTFNVEDSEGLSEAVSTALKHLLTKSDLEKRGSRYILAKELGDEKEKSARARSSMNSDDTVITETVISKKKKKKKTELHDESPSVHSEDTPTPSTSTVKSPEKKSKTPSSADKITDRTPERRQSTSKTPSSADKITEKSLERRLSSSKIPEKKSAVKTSPVEARTPIKDESVDRSITPKKNISEEKWTTKTSGEKDVKEKLTSISPKPRYPSDEKTPKIRALLEDRRSAVRSPDALLKSPIRKRSISDDKAAHKVSPVEKAMGPPAATESAVRTKKSFQKASRLNELIKQKPLNLSVDRDDQLPSTSNGTSIQNIGADPKKIDPPPKKKRGRPFKKPPVEEPRKKSTSRSSSRIVKSSDDEVPDGFLDPGFEESIPKELRDGLSKYFTPSLKRKSRVAINTLLPNAVSAARSRSSKKTTDSETTEDDAPKAPVTSKKSMGTKPKQKVVIVDESSDWESEEPVERQRRPSSSSGKPERKRGKKCGSTQLKSLQDGLTKYFTAAGDRKRRPPVSYAGPLVYRRRKELTDDKGASDRSQSDSSKSLGRQPRSIRSEEVISPTGSSASKSKFRVPDVIPNDLEVLFRKARDRALKKIPTVTDDYDGPLPPRVQLGDKKIKTWYTSPFPEEYIRCKCLYLCEFCLQYMKTLGVLKSHYEKCPWHRPPGTEIYHDSMDVNSSGTDVAQELVIYETDGNDWKEYCQNLCLLAKLYLDHKTLYYDVEPFLFYVLCRRDKFGDHLIGYFSKEKNSPQRYNVSCIMVLPPFQGDGYGRFLIDFSYLLSRVETQHGTPEKPLSEMGQWSYSAYWKSAVLDFFLEQRVKESTTTSVKAICDATGMWPQDVADTLQSLNFIIKNDDTQTWEFNLIQDVLDTYQEKKLIGKKRILLQNSKLHWDPWKGEVPGATTTESEHSGSHRADQQVETGDEQKAEKRTSASSESDEAEQATAARKSPSQARGKTPPKPPQRSRTPRAGRQSTHKSSSRERSPRPTPSPPPTTSSPSRRKASVPSGYARRRSRVRDVFGGRRRKRRGKFRSRPRSSTATSSQPKNYKGRREELRAGSEKRRKQHHGRPADYEDSGEESDLSSSFYTGIRSRRSSMSSESSADESLASEPTRTFSRGSKSYLHKDTGNESSSSSSEVSSSRSLSHLDLPPRAPHPPEPVDMMDQGISTDSPPIVQAVVPSPRNPPAAAAAPPPPPQHRVAEICIQTEPIELAALPPPAMSVPVESVQEPKSHHSLHQEYAHVAEVQSEALNSQVTRHMPPTEMPQPNIGPSMPLSPPIPHLQQQPHTPYRHQQPSPMVGSIPSVNKPASVMSMHDSQMQDTEMIMSQPQYEPQYDQYATPQHTPGLSATSPVGFQLQHQQASPVAAQPSVSYVSTYQESPRSQQPPTPYHEILRPPHTPTTPVAAASVYMNPSPRPAAPFIENVSSPHAPRMLQTPMPYQDPYQATASVVNFEQTRSVHGGHARVQQAYSDCAQAQAQEAFPAYNQKVIQQPPQQTMQQTMQHPMHSAVTQRQQPSHHPPSRKTKQRANEPTVSSNYAQVTNQQVPQPFMFHPSYGHAASNMIMQFPGMQEQHPGYSMGMHQASNPSDLAKLTQLTQGLSGQHAHMGLHPYNVAAASTQRTSQSSHPTRQSQHLQHPMQASGTPMQMPGASMSPMQYQQYLQKGMQTFPGQQPVMTPSYPQSFFGQGVPMPGQVQVPAGQYRPVGPSQAQSMYPGYPYYTPGAQHPHHAAMRQ